MERRGCKAGFAVSSMKGVLLTILFLSVSLISCREPAPVLLPSTSEQLALSIQPNPAGGDPLPRVRISAGSGSVTMVVTQPWVCGGRVTAGVNRAPGDLAIVVRQILDSSVVCVPMIAVLDYTGTITGLSAGSYRVRVFEAQSNSRSRLLGSTTVSVSTPAT
jgi:hypothetical protein